MDKLKTEIDAYEKSIRSSRQEAMEKISGCFSLDNCLMRSSEWQTEETSFFLQSLLTGPMSYMGHFQKKYTFWIWVYRKTSVHQL